MLCGMDAFLDELVGGRGLLASVGEANRGIVTNGKEVLLAGDPITVAPKLGAIGLHFEIEPATVRKFDRLCTCLGVADAGVGQAHVMLLLRYPHRYPLFCWLTTDPGAPPWTSPLENMVFFK